MSIYEYDEARQRQFDREEGWRSGLAEGQQIGLAEEQKNGIKNLIKTSMEFNSSREDTVKRVFQKYSLAEDKVLEYMKKYWKN